MCQVTVESRTPFAITGPLLSQLAALGYMPADINLSRALTLSQRSRGERQRLFRFHLGRSGRREGRYVREALRQSSGGVERS
jgi:hypothetical protein